MSTPPMDEPYLTNHMIQAAKAAVVRVDVEDAHGAGFFVGDHGLVATNCHVLEGYQRCLLHAWDGQAGEAGVVVADNRNDVAVLRSIDLRTKQVLLCSQRDVDDGDPVWAIGMPHGLDFSITRGIVSAAYRQHNGRRLIQTDVSLNPGSSGGPLLNRHGQVVGICVSGRRDAAGLNFAVPISILAGLLDRLDPRTLDAGWHCHACGDWRSPSERFCQRCGGSRPRAEEGPARLRTTTGLLQPLSGGVEPPAPWACPACRKDNEGHARYCARCGSARRTSA